MDPKVAAIYNHLKTWVDGTQELNSGSIVVLVTQVISLVQQEIPEHGRGSYKKHVAMSVIKQIVHDSDVDESTKQTLTFLIDTTVPPMIDAMVSIARQEIDLHKLKKNLMTSCFCT